MTALSYAELIYPAPSDFSQSRVEESLASYSVFTERHLQAIWLEQKYFNQLVTTDGSTITVLSPGIWNAEAGPDFLKAHLLIGNEEYKGDIEIHLSPESWTSHKHHLDPRYDQVILHLSFWKPTQALSIQTSQKANIPQASLEDCLTIPESRIIKLIDLDLYPYKRFSGTGKCSQKLFNTLADEKIIRLFRSAAAWRLIQKRQYLEAKFHSPTDYIVGGIARALGYKHNSEAFAQLFLILKSLLPADEKTLFSTALGLCGFFNNHFRIKWSHSAYYQDLDLHFSSQKNLPSISLRLDKIRPANHPVRRLALLSKLLVDKTTDTLAAKLTKCWEEHWRAPKKRGWHKMKQAILEIIPLFNDPYWEHHYTFEQESQPRLIALMGEDLKREIILNVFLPLLYGEIETRAIPEEMEAFQQFYASLPASNSKKATYLSHRFFGDSPKDALLMQADTQQGAYQVHHDFCTHYEASCIGCPFVERYINLERRDSKVDISS